jgi:hypothetical protein
VNGTTGRVENGIRAPGSTRNSAAGPDISRLVDSAGPSFEPDAREGRAARQKEETSMNPFKKLGAVLVVPLLAGGFFAIHGSSTDAASPPTCFGVAATIIALTTAPVYGGPGDDVIVGNGLDNVIYGNGGNDIICGGGGDDKLDGGAGLDVVWGEAGSDKLQGRDDRDILFGNDGNDDLDGGAGIDVLDGGNGSDTCTGGGGPTILFSC